MEYVMDPIIFWATILLSYKHQHHLTRVSQSLPSLQHFLQVEQWGPFTLLTGANHYRYKFYLWFPRSTCWKYFRCAWNIRVASPLLGQLNESIGHWVVGQWVVLAHKELLSLIAHCCCIMYLTQSSTQPSKSCVNFLVDSSTLQHLLRNTQIFIII
jgi:hypothetical protein